jgi:heme/copper-type cytochrome/quinol oxidase subunit 1
MDWVVRAFIKTSLAWLAIGVALGLAMALYPPLTVYRTAHLHINLLGFVAQMIYGVSLHVVPRFFGHPLVHPRLGEAQFWLAQPGLALLAGGFALRVTNTGPSGALIVAGASLSSAAAACYIVNVWRTINASEMKPLSRGKPVPLARQPQAD